MTTGPRDGPAAVFLLFTYCWNSQAALLYLRAPHRPPTRGNARPARKGQETCVAFLPVAVGAKWFWCSVLLHALLERLGPPGLHGSARHVGSVPVHLRSVTDCPPFSFRSEAMTLLHIPARFWPAIVVPLMWGIVSLLQKLSTNHVSAGSALVWLVVGYALLIFWTYPGQGLQLHSGRCLLLILLSARLNTHGAWALLAAMRSEGKVSVVVPLTAFYPVVVVLVASPSFMSQYLWCKESAWFTL